MRHGRRSTGSVLVLAVLPAASLAVWAQAVVPAESALEDRRRIAEELRLDVEREQRRGEVLRTLRESLATDPQTIERELRARGRGRADETKLVPTESR